MRNEGRQNMPFGVLSEFPTTSIVGEGFHALPNFLKNNNTSRLNHNITKIKAKRRMACFAYINVDDSQHIEFAERQIYRVRVSEHIESRRDTIILHFAFILYTALFHHLNIHMKCCKNGS